MSYSSTLGSNQAEAPSALLLNGMKNGEMRSKLYLKDVYNLEAVSKTRESDIRKELMELN